MKLQVNLAGSWRDVLHFSEVSRMAVQRDAGRLLANAEGRVSMRIADDKNVAIAHCGAPSFEWKDARRGKF